MPVAGAQGSVRRGHVSVKTKRVRGGRPLHLSQRVRGGGGAAIPILIKTQSGHTLLVHVSAHDTIEVR